jgi:hypothetical protein
VTAESITIRPKSVVVDIDGTVASHVLPDGTLLRDYHQYRGVIWDEPKHEVIAVVHALRDAGFQIVFCSGRPEEDDSLYDVGRATFHWLAEHLGELSCPLFLRRSGDKRPDDIVKREIYEQLILPAYDVRIALDDRDRVVAMWRSLGITCLQAAPGDF